MVNSWKRKTKELVVCRIRGTALLILLGKINLWKTREGGTRISLEFTKDRQQSDNKRWRCKGKIKTRGGDVRSPAGQHRENLPAGETSDGFEKEPSGKISSGLRTRWIVDNSKPDLS